MRRQPLPVVVFVALTVALALKTAAAPPENANPALHGWFDSLKQPGSGIPCCSVADCRPVEYRLASAGYEALLDKRWIPVPDDKVVRGKANPLGRAIVCRSPISGSILCFVPASDA